MVTVDLDPPHEGPDDLAGADPIEVMQAVSDLGCKVLKLAHDQGEFALGLCGFGCGALLVLELGHARPESGHARLELRAVDHAGGVAVDQSADPALEGCCLLPELGQFVCSNRAVAGLVQAAPVFVSQRVRRFQQGADPLPNRLLEMVGPHGPVAAQSGAPEAIPVSADAAILAILAL